MGSEFYCWPFSGNCLPKPENDQKSTFQVDNQNSESTFISATFKVEEIKVGSEF